MRKKFISIMLATAMAAGLAGCGGSGGTNTGAATADTQATEAQREEVKDDVKKEDEKEDLKASDGGRASNFHIGITTSSVSQSENDRCGAEAFQAMYGEDTVKLAIYPDNSTEELKITVQTVANLSDDPKIEATIMNQPVPGIVEALRKIRETRPDVPCITDKGHEDLPEISSATDLVCSSDFVARGYLIARTAHKLGCDTFVRTSFPRHVVYETMSRRVAVIGEVYKGFGMEFVLETAPDPTSGVGVVGAQAYILKKVPGWVGKYGKNAAYFCTNDAHAEPLLKQLMEYGDYFIEADLPSPLMGYPDALGTDLTVETGDFDKVPAKVEFTIVERGGADRFGMWVYPCGYATSAGLAQYAPNVLSGENKLDDVDDIAKAYQIFSPRAEWNGSSYTNVGTGIRLDNAFLVHQGTCVVGNPRYFMGSIKIEVPEKYLAIK